MPIVANGPNVRNGIPGWSATNGACGYTSVVRTPVFVISAVCAAIASILYTARLETGRPKPGAGNFLLHVIGATVIGGTSLFGGKGKILWTFFGVLFFVLLSNTLNLMNLSTFHIDMVKGGVILAAALLDVTRTRLTRAAT